jgi:AAA domain
VALARPACDGEDDADHRRARLGQTLLACDCASRVSRGATWPDSAPAPKGRIIIMSSEDGIADTIAPRLDAAGADCSQIAVLRMAVRQGVESMVTLAEDLDMLERAIIDQRATLLIVDPLSAYLGDTDSHRDAALRGVLTPVADLLERTGVACIGVMHPPKSVTNIVYFASGSGAFTAQARVVLGVGRDPNDEIDRRRCS